MQRNNFRVSLPRGRAVLLRVEVGSMILCRYWFARWFVLGEAESEGHTLLLCYAARRCVLESVP